MTKFLYFAYGANLNKRSMQHRCPEAIPCGAAKLTDHRLVFKYHADVEPAEGSEVPGAAWEITESCLQSLDRFEGYPEYYTRRLGAIRLADGREKQAILYQMNGTEYSQPSGSYLNTIAEGYDDFGLDKEPLDKAVWKAKIKEAANIGTAKKGASE